MFSGVTVWRTQLIKLSNQCVYIVLNLPSLSVLMHVSDAYINAEPFLVPSKIFFFFSCVEIFAQEVDFY